MPESVLAHVVRRERWVPVERCRGGGGSLSTRLGWLAQTSQCEEGACGSGETAVLDGLPGHGDAMLIDEERTENSVMMVCASRARGPRLVLDL